MDDTAELLKQINGESTVGRLLQSLAGFADPYLDKVGLRLSTPDELRHGIADTASAIPRTLGFADPTAPYQAGESAVTRGAQNAAAIAGLLPMPSGPQHPATPSAQAVAAHPGAMPPPVGEPQPMNAETTMKMYAGAEAKTADQKALGEAMDRRMAGDDPETVRRETGWFIGPDGMWRFEIADDKARFDAEKFLIKGAQPLSEIMDHEELFKAYPGLRDLMVKPSKRSGGAFVRGPDAPPQILLDENMAIKHGPATQRSVALHEVQHAIQDLEGFAPGSSPEKFLKHLGERLEQDRLHAENLYKRTMGEVEARDTQWRHNLTSEERKVFRPYGSQQIPVEQMINSSDDLEQVVARNPFVPLNPPAPPFKTW